MKMEYQRCVGGGVECLTVAKLIGTGTRERQDRERVSQGRSMPAPSASGVVTVTVQHGLSLLFSSRRC